MTGPWPEGTTGLLRLPSGRLVRGRALFGSDPRRPSSTESPGCSAGSDPSLRPDFGLYLAGFRPAPRPWPSLWVRWPDFGLPIDRPEAYTALTKTWRRTVTERVEIGCRGGRGRTGTALACLVVLDGLSPGEAIDFVRQRYHRRAVETPWQRRWIERFAAR